MPLRVAILELLISALLVCSQCAWAEERPNILLIISDDQRFDSLTGFMPTVESRLFKEGLSFEKAYIATPACCPSRASMLTGLYSRRHGVFINEDLLQRKTVVNDLHDAGYYTGLVGKYLNSWNGSPRGEFNFWVSFPGGSVDYFNPRLVIDGELARQEGYITELLQEQAVRFIRRAAQQPKPFFLIFTPNAPHQPAAPAPGDETAYSDLPLHRPPNYLELDRSDKPTWLQQIPLPSAERRAQFDLFRLNQFRTLRSLDRAVAAILEELEKTRLLERTLIFYISDNGVFWGEHGLESKDCAYEEAVHVPFAVRLPGGLRGVSSSQLVANIDIAPTIYAAAKISQQSALDGSSLLPLLKGESAAWREDLLLEGFRRNDRREPFQAVHTGRFVYIENSGGERELYDLANDPYQLNSVVLDTDYSQVATRLESRLAAILGRDVPTPPADEFTPVAVATDSAENDVFNNVLSEVPPEDSLPLVPESSSDAAPPDPTVVGRWDRAVPGPSLSATLGPTATAQEELSEMQETPGAEALVEEAILASLEMTAAPVGTSNSDAAGSIASNPVVTPAESEIASQIATAAAARTQKPESRRIAERSKQEQKEKQTEPKLPWWRRLGRWLIDLWRAVAEWVISWF